ncbi:MAG TPA: TAXI family TRAP transporter solute-binding subunit [Vicinamibacteria bacterium]|nr:TAXI family TRAP transporter solute-binding subunit [Vicinamibacteria bacterium]
MKNRLLLACGLLVSISCGGGSSRTADDRRFLSVGTAPPGGAFFVVGGALGEVLGEFGPAGWEVTSEATKGSQENIRRLASGELDVALSNAAITYFAARGEDDWERAYDVRTVMTLAPNVAMLLAPQGSGVESIPDIRGKRIVVGPAGAGWESFVSRIFAAHGVGFEEFTPLNNTQAGSVDMLADGSAAAAFIGGAVPTASIVQATTSQDILLVPFDDAAIESLSATYPFFDVRIVPGGTYRGQDEDFRGLDVGSMHLIASAGADEELIYQITKTIYENRAAVTARHPAGNFINPENVTRDTGVAFHPGAVRYYREIGIWPEGEG